MTALTEQPKQPEYQYNRETRRKTMLEAKRILKWHDKGYSVDKIVHKLGWPNPSNATKYVTDLLTFTKRI